MNTPDLSARRFLLFGFFAILCLVAGFGTWSATTRISGAVIAQGALQGRDDDHVVQSQSGGTIASIHVQEGDLVEKNKTLATLDGQHLLSQKAILDSQYNEVLAQIARLEAEQKQAQKVTYPAALIAQSDLRNLIADQTHLFEASRKRRRAIEALHKTHIARIEHRQIRLQEQYKTNQKQLSLLQTDLKRHNALLEKGLTQLDRVLLLQREQTALEGTLTDITNQLSEIALQKSELSIQHTTRKIEERNALMSELRTLRADAAELLEKRRYITFELENLILRAPASGIVQRLTPSHPHAVIPPGHTLMHIIPNHTELHVTVRINPSDIRHIFIGQPARITLNTTHVSGQNHLTGKVIYIAADVLEDARTPQQFYEVRISIAPDPAAQAFRKTKPPMGMPATVFIQTNTGNPISYLLHPFLMFFDKALREPGT